jgi:tight adherence protein B
MNPWIGIIGGIVVIILLIIGMVVTTSREQTLVEERLSQYIGEKDSSRSENEAQRTAITDWVSKRVERTSFGDRISQSLARADIKLKVGEYFSVIFIAIFVLGAITWLIGGRNVVSFLIGAAAGLIIPGIYVNQQQSKRLTKFNEQLADMLNLMVNGLRAGYSTLQAMEAISKEMPPPISEEFRRVVQEMQIGLPMDTALANLVRRIPSDDLDFVITAINVQREVGGNLSEILETISFTIRERVKIKGEIRVVTSQVRASGTLLALIPVFLTIVLWFLNPKYLMSFMDAGPLCAIGAGIVVVILIGSGYFIMMRIASIEV